MYPWCRMIRVVSGALGKSNVDLLGTTSVRLRIYANDLDFNFHVNNGRYLALADIGRVDWFLRTGILRAARRYKAIPVIGDAVAKFRQNLRLFHAFEIHTRLIGWDDKWGFIEHRFVRADRVIGVVAIRGVFKAPGGPIEPDVLLASLSRNAPSPKLPDWAVRFDDSSELLSKVLRDEESQRTTPV